MRHSPVTAQFNHNDSSRLLTNGFANGLDDAIELISGVRDHYRAHGELPGVDETCNTLGDRWSSLQAFMGAQS